MKNIIKDFIVSAKTLPTEKELNDIFSWVDEKNKTLKVSIVKNKLSDSNTWFYDADEGEIRNQNRSFFSIKGLKRYSDATLVLEQPVLLQDEIGYLGIICKRIDGILHFLMQAKIEPGNVNKIQISPTIQATKSNFTRKHGGKKPAYLDYFLDAQPENIVVDQIQSEQSSRFLGKRNRNIIIYTEDDVEVLPSHRFMTLGTIQRLLETDNLVNMDTRTVLSCIPYSKYNFSETEKKEIEALFSSKALFNSFFGETDNEDFVRVYRYINDYKMLNAKKSETVPLTSLASWNFDDSGITHREAYPFKVVFCDIEIEGREVTHWTQPLFEATGIATFGLIMADINGKTRFLVHAKEEAGCFDGIELGPTVQLEYSEKPEPLDSIGEMFFDLLSNTRPVTDVILSEEGGRFYCEQNRNIIIKAEGDIPKKLPSGYFWLDYKTLNGMVQHNNVLNIQLRNLLSLIRI